ncbi:Alpha/Beta hydrolase protein [Baffinella frigidus]|nr:Alpha/Beta hydrolase protein [Cryptophyta sp. CCMP2293]
MVPEVSMNMVPEVSMNMVPEVSMNMVPEVSMNMVPEFPGMLFGMAMIAQADKQTFADYCATIVAQIEAGRMAEAFRIWDEMLNGDLSPYPSLFFNVTGSKDYDNTLNTLAPASFDYFNQFVDSPAARAALHVGSVPFGTNATDCEMSLKADFMRSMVPEMVALIPHYKVLIYSGSLDIIVGAPLTDAFLSKMEFEGSPAFHAAPRTPFHLCAKDDDVAGYVKHAGRFTQAVVRGAGHILPHDQPKRARDMIRRFVSSDSGWAPPAC